MYPMMIPFWYSWDGGSQTIIIEVAFSEVALALFGDPAGSTESIHQRTNTTLLVGFCINEENVTCYQLELGK